MSSQSSQIILELYREIVAVTTAMLNSARAQDWSSVLQFGQTYCEIVERLRTIGVTEPLDDAERRQKHDMLVQILENDANTRDLAIPELARMSELLGRMKRQQAALNAYGFKAHVV
ncbi:flagellar protein FliT [Bordetella bronchialis]|uniref:Flagellar protein FliT n=1 Tax=Bordetella bronchialis TaxID=463025 RepID=A0A193FGS1_9BORD|nr:flagellar protein FliT [Bordetella bronchialis]ANN66835.1 flagellar assembly protein FliT [Bordetella bronchialis]ANN71911.1 flagellar assembly protein FliT [Bordetella bronchialis]